MISQINQAKASGLNRFKSLASYGNADAKRSFLNTCLGNDPAWTGKFFDFVSVWNEKVIEIEGMTNHGYGESEFYNARKYYFERCFLKRGKGIVYQTPKEIEIINQRAHCQEVLCLYCEEKRRDKLSRENFDLWKEIIEKNEKGFPGTLHLEFTLPEVLEGQVFANRKKLNELKNEIKKIVWSLFGLYTIKGKRPNLGMQFSEHPVGSSDITRKRWHLHVDVIPGVVDNDQFKWLKTTDSTKDWLLKIDLKNLRRLWSKALEKVYSLQINEPVVYVKAIYYGNKKEMHELFWRRLMHRLKYDMRSFIRDIKLSFLRVNKETKEVVLKNGDDYRVIKISDLIDQFKWIRENNQTRRQGFLNRIEKYIEILGILREVTEMREVNLSNYVAVEAEFETVHEKRYDEKMKRFVNVHKTIWRWKDPFTGKMRVKDEDEMTDYYSLKITN